MLGGIPAHRVFQLLLIALFAVTVRQVHTATELDRCLNACVRSLKNEVTTHHLIACSKLCKDPVTARKSLETLDFAAMLKRQSESQGKGKSIRRSRKKEAPLPDLPTKRASPSSATNTDTASPSPSVKASTDSKNELSKTAVKHNQTSSTPPSSSSSGTSSTKKEERKNDSSSKEYSEKSSGGSMPSSSKDSNTSTGKGKKGSKTRLSSTRSETKRPPLDVNKGEIHMTTVKERLEKRRAMALQTAALSSKMEKEGGGIAGLMKDGEGQHGGSIPTSMKQEEKGSESETTSNDEVDSKNTEKSESVNASHTESRSDGDREKAEDEDERAKQAAAEMEEELSDMERNYPSLSAYVPPEQGMAWLSLCGSEEEKEEDVVNATAEGGDDRSDGDVDWSEAKTGANITSSDSSNNTRIGTKLYISQKGVNDSHEKKAMSDDWMVIYFDPSQPSSLCQLLEREGLERHFKEVYAPHILQYYPLFVAESRDDQKIYSLLDTILLLSRVLDDGGVLSLSVPDFTTLAWMQTQPQLSMDTRINIQNALMGGVDMGLSRGPGHASTLDEDILSMLLTQGPFWSYSRVSTLSFFGADWSSSKINGVSVALNAVLRKAGDSAAEPGDGGT